MRRSKEFDKPDLISNAFYGIAPEFHAVQTTSDSWRYQRKLIQDLVTPAFLSEVAAPQLHHNFMDLIKMWTEKTRLGEGRPFNVRHDIYETALEAIWAAIFGIEGTATVTRNQIELLSAQKTMTLPSSVDTAVEFERAPAPPTFRAVLDLTDSIEEVVKSPFPKVTGFVQRYLPAGRKNLALKDRFIAEEIAKAEKRLKANNGKETKITNGVDHMLRKENMAAEKLGRAPVYQSRTFVSEVSFLSFHIHTHMTDPTSQLFGLLIAGHDTTSTTLLWSLKFLAADQPVQNKLRGEMRSMFAAAHAEQRVPTSHEIATASNHYLDACIEEINRCSGTGGITSRTAMKDTTVLGHFIPKGTMLLFLGRGGGILEPEFDIPDSLRSEQFHKAGGGKAGRWDPTSIKKFDPDRWLVRDKDTGTEVFDSTAGPHIAFGAGLRGCFGRKLAMLELRLAIVLILWHFELQQVPEEYGGWGGKDGLTYSPAKCYVKLAKA
jgi:cytochrome P450